MSFENFIVSLNQNFMFSPKKLAFIFLFIFGCLAIDAQSLENFTRIKSEGDIPTFFTRYLEFQIAADNQELSDDERISDKNAIDFSSMSNFLLQKTLRSGRVLYGDPITVYANKVLDKVKAASDEDLSHIEVFTLKSNEVNAFATHQGIIFITIGLIGQLENEAQLAYILAHEITHVKNNHNALSYQHSNDLANSRKFEDSKISEYYQYSKDNEEEADKEGFQLAIDAGYDATEIFQTFNVLLYSYLPIDEYELDFKWLENDGFKIIDKYKLEKPNPISASAEVDDEFHTHPNINSRRISVKRLYKKHKDSDNAIYLVGDEGDFMKLRALARFEMMNIFLKQGDYINGLYHNRVLQQKHKDNVFLVNTEAMIWYGLAAHENHNEDKPYSTYYKKKEGEIQHLYYLFRKLKTVDINTLATKQIWETSQRYPKNDFLLSLREKVIDEWVSHESNRPENFATQLMLVDDTEIEEEEDEPESKYDKIAKTRKENSTETFSYYALLDVIKNEDFTDEVELALNKKSKEDDEEDEESYSPVENDINIDNLIMLTPHYTYSDDRKTVRKNVNRNATTENEMLSQVKSNAELLGIELKYMDNFYAEGFNTEMYNQFSLMYDYLIERSQYSGMDFLPYYSQFISDITSEYGTKYVGIFHQETNIEKRPFAPGTAILSAVIFYTFPFYLKWQLTPDKATNYGFVVYNLETHNPAFVTQKFYVADMNKYVQNAHIYKTLNQIKEKPK